MKKNHRRYAMVCFYAASRKMQVTEATNEQCIDRLNTVFDDLIENYGVVLEECAIIGLSGHVLQSWFNKFVDTRKPSTINNYVSFINPFLRWAYNIGYIEKDISRVLQNVPIPSVETLPEWERPKDKYMTHEEVERLLNATYSSRDRAIVALFLYSGIRVSELCSLTLDSVLKPEKGKIYCKRKGGKWKYVDVADEFYEYLSEYLAERDDILDRQAPLFISSRGGHLDRRTIYAALSKIQRELGLATGPHVLRHTFISEVDKIGGPSVARDLANHSSLRVTNRYDHTTEEQRRETISRLSWCKEFQAIRKKSV